MKNSMPNKIPSIRDSHIYLLITLVACIIYAKSIVYQYTYFDDIYLLFVNHEFLSNLANLPKLFTTDVFISVTNPEIFYRPLMNVLFMLEMQVSKDSLVLFHITNIILHIGCSFLLFVVFKQLRIPRHIAAAAALIFCAHPLNTSAVVWIPGRNDTLLTLFVLASISLFLRALETKRIWHWVGHLIFFFLALLTKETAFALLILCPSYFFFIRREKLSRTTILSVGVTYLVLVAVWLGMRSMVTHSYDAHQSLVTFATSWLSNAPAFVLYIGKA